MVTSTLKKAKPFRFMHSQTPATSYHSIYSHKLCYKSHLERSQPGTGAVEVAMETAQEEALHQGKNSPKHPQPYRNPQALLKELHKYFHGYSLRRTSCDYSRAPGCQVLHRLPSVLQAALCPGVVQAVYSAGCAFLPAGLSLHPEVSLYCNNHSSERLKLFFVFLANYKK